MDSVAAGENAINYHKYFNLTTKQITGGSGENEDESHDRDPIGSCLPEATGTKYTYMFLKSRLVPGEVLRLYVKKGGASMKSKDKTNVMRVLDAKKVSYESHSYDEDPSLSGEQIADILGEEPACVFKTLVTQGKSGGYYVFVVPVEAELDLKKAAKAAGEKSVAMIKQKELLPLTGYVHGGCSPIGMKKKFPTFIHDTSKSFEKVFVSAGKVGHQIEIAPDDLIAVAGCTVADIV